MNIKILSEKSISMTELRKSLEKIEEKDKELNFRANKTKDYLHNFILLDEKVEKELKKKIESLKIPRLKQEHIIKILDVVPKNLEELKNVLQQFTITVSNDNLKKIVSAIKDIVPEKAKKVKKEKK